MFLPLLFAALSATPSAAQDPLHADRLAADLEFLADDVMEGRDASSRGGHAAARFLAARFEQIGLETVLGNRLHEISLKPLHLDHETTYLEFQGRRFTPGKGFVPHPSAPFGEVSGRVVFGGYGIQDSENHYDDLEGLDVQGAIVLLLRYEAKTGKGKPLSALARVSAKVLNLQQRGAVAVLLVNSPADSIMPGHKEAAGWFLWPQLSPLVKIWNPQLGLEEVREAYTRMNFREADAAEVLFVEKQHHAPLGVKIPVAYISLTAAEQITRKGPVSLYEWEKAARENPSQARGFDCDSQVQIRVKELDLSQGKGFNVIGVLPGKNPNLTQELLVIGAHYDHVGMNDAGEIWNGADDNASGVAALLGLAEYFSQEEHRLQRSLVFVAFSGEERGLLGAHAFLRESTVNIENVGLMMNFEMIGRAAKQRFAMIGARSGVGLEALIPRDALPLPWSLEEDHETFFDRSDQAPFHRLGIPTLLFTTGDHEDYHRPSDQSEKINLAGIETVTRFAVETLIAVDAQSSLPSFHDYLELHAVNFGTEPQNQGLLPLPFSELLDY